MTAPRMATEEKMGDGDDKNGNGGMKRVKKKGGSIGGSVLREEGDDFNNNKCKYIYIL